MPTLYQGYVFMALIYSGMLFGIAYQAKIFLSNMLDNYFINFVIDFVFAIIGGIIFWFAIFRANLGIFRIFLLISYIFGFMLIDFSLSNMVATISKKLYNSFNEKKNKSKKATN